MYIKTNDMEITHLPLWLELYGDPSVFVPDESYPFAWDWDYDVESHGVYGEKCMILKHPTTVVAYGHLHVAQRQGDFVLGKTAQVGEYF